MIQRFLFSRLQQDLFTGKAICVMGARQTGKTTLLQQLFEQREDVLWLNADLQQVRDLFTTVTLGTWRSIIGSHKIAVVDEAQRIADVGIKMKLLTDNFHDVQLILTGSSSFALSNQINEPLTGRKWEYRLYPLSFAELAQHFGTIEEIGNLSVRLLYGSYPEIVCHPGEEEKRLNLLADSYLYKDILEWGGIKKPDKLTKLLQALAYQIGSQVSYNELGNMLQLDAETVEKYIHILEQTHVIFRVGSFSRNMRNELKFAKKIYFYDNGIRNALIHNFAPIDIRTDNGSLWENWMLSELRKKQDYQNGYTNMYFWRTTTQKEIDYIGETNGVIQAYEMKWNPNKKSRNHDDFLQAYPNATLQTITPHNFMEILLDETK
ncbi:MAG: ATP-binding protein [Paludibacteraceae bacterium]|nr:ATP-binding protein [Paludibacteraceae bacterium]